MHVVWADPVGYELPPHFPQPGADPIALLEAALADKDEQIASLYAEARAWREQLEAALVRAEAAEAMACVCPTQTEL